MKQAFNFVQHVVFFYRGLSVIKASSFSNTSLMPVTTSIKTTGRILFNYNEL